jgi:MFS family permease
MAQLIAFRALQGICAGAIFPFSVAIIADVFPIEQRARGFSIVPSAFAFSSVLGPTAGGFITTGLGWRWIFFLNVPVVLIALGVLTLVYHESAPMRRLALRDIDIAGAVLIAGALVAALVAISIGGGPVPWLSWQESLLWTCTVALAVAFALWERRMRIPLLPLRILRHRGLGGALLTIALLIWIVDSLIFFIPSLAQGALGGTAQSAGIILIPLMLTWSLTALVSVRAGQRDGFRTLALGGCVALSAAMIALTLVRADASQDALVLPMLLAGLGAGLINPNMMLLAQNSLSDRDQGLAGGLGGCTLVLVAALVGPLLAALEVGRLAVHMGGRLPDTSQLLSAQGRHNLTLQFGADYVHDLRLALGATLHDVFSAGFIALAVVTLVLLLIVPSNALARRIRLAPLSR